MTQLGESTVSLQVKEPKDEKVQSIKIRYSVFFDGTLNNQVNINSRLISVDESELTAEERKTARELKDTLEPGELRSLQIAYKNNKKEDSYQNGYTNIVKLERNIDPAPKDPYQLGFAAYVEGPGTEDKDGDHMRGYAFGTGSTGVKKKVDKAMDKLVKWVKKNHKEKDKPVELLTLDSFGFSRGAAGARYFISRALTGDDSIANRLVQLGYKVSVVECKFSGLFDTVSSHGLSFNNDTAALRLNAVMKAQQAVHLAAADEHRKNFSLTDIKSALYKNGIQVYLPGVHSDVGGSYRDNQPDGLKNGKKSLMIYSSFGINALQKAQQEKDRLIRSGWYRSDEIELVYDDGTMAVEPSGFPTAWLYAGRASVSNQYSRIPLHIMAEFAIEQGIVFKDDLNSGEKVPGALKSVEKELKAYVARHKAPASSSARDYSSQASDWHDDARPWLCQLRHDYFHFSAHYQFGLAPRFSGGQRHRKVLGG